MGKSRPSKTKAAPRVASSWPVEIQQWLESYAEGEKRPSETEQRLRIRLARDARFRGLREALIEAAHGTHAGSYEPIAHFLEFAFSLPDMWERFKEQSPDALWDVGLPLQRASDGFLRAVAAQPQLVKVFLRGSSATQGERKYEELVSMIKEIQAGALSIRSLLSPADLPKVPRKRNVPTARERFFAQNLVRSARELFGVPLYKEVGELAALCLSLAHSIPSKLVMEYCRERPKAAIHKKK